MKKAMTYNRREPVDCKPNGNAKEAWFYVNEGSITVVTDVGGQATLTRQQLLNALNAMRPVRTRGAERVRGSLPVEVTDKHETG